MENLLLQAKQVVVVVLSFPRRTSDWFSLNDLTKHFSLQQTFPVSFIGYIKHTAWAAYLAAEEHNVSETFNYML